MYATLYQTRYEDNAAHVSVIKQLATSAAKYGGVLECGFIQGAEDLLTGASHPQDFTKDGICFALVIMWLRTKFEKKADSEFYQWLFADDVRARNLKMSRWMQKQLFAIDLASERQAEVHSQFMNLKDKGAVYSEFLGRYPKADLPGWVNFVSEKGNRGAPLDRSYDPAKYAGKSQRARYDLDKETRSYQLTQLDRKLDVCEVWKEEDTERGDVYALQLAASKITKSATSSNRLSSKDRIVSLALQGGYDPDTDEDGGRKRMEAAQLLVDSLLKYQKELKNQDQFVLVSFCKHVVGVFFSRSPWTGNGSIHFFDPNYGIWSFESSSRDERCANFRKFFFVISLLYKELDSLSIKILSRH